MPELLADFYRRKAGSTILTSYKPRTGRRTKVVIDAESGLPLIINTQNVRPIVEANKRAQSMFDPHVARKVNVSSSGMQRIASIPNVIYMKLRRLGIAQNPRLLNAWLNRRDTQVFRTDDGRKL